MLFFFGKHKKALNSLIVRTIALLFLSFIMLTFAAPVYAELTPEEKNFLLMYFKEEELEVVSTTRSLKSITRVAENVEVVTAADIELMNAHTLADVLNTVNGVVVSFSGASPGSISVASIQGSAAEHVVVFIDGIAINFIASDQTDLALIPVQMIERVEIIKGPASSVWGSSLGGVINVITKSPGKKEGVNGTLSASYGEKNTGDFRAEISGKNSAVGYYLYTGRLQTDGLRSFEKISFNNIYAKFTYDVTSRTNIGVSLFYNKGDRENGDLSAIDLSFKNRLENMFTTLNLNSTLSDGLDLNLSLRAARERSDSDFETLSSGESSTVPVDDRKYGASARLTWKTGVHNIVMSSDYDYRKEISTIYLGEMPSLNVFAVYANDTITINKFSVTPGIRYDHTDRNADFTSPSLGVTYEVCDKTIVRADVARGFHLPNLGEIVADNLNFIHNPNLKPEEVWSYQAGLESALLKYLWLKASLFRYDISDAIIAVPVDPNDPNSLSTVVNAEKARRQGFEIEMRTVKFWNITLFAGAAFVHSKDLTTGETIHEMPDYAYDVSLKYDDERSFRALLKGRYVRWHNTDGVNPKSDFILDLNLMKTFFRTQSSSCEVFLTGHNIFNGSQYPDELFKNARRWIEGGVRYKF
jgi:vitamin B12 transporter